MSANDETTDLTEQTEDAATGRTTVLQRLARRFITAEETAALLEVNESLFTGRPQTGLDDCLWVFLDVSERTCLSIGKRSSLGSLECADMSNV